MIPICFALATMMSWWPEGYLAIVRLPLLGYFRVPARYTLLCSFGLAVLAGEGFDRTISRSRFRSGVCSAIVFAALALAAALLWTTRPEVHLRALAAGIPGGFFWCALAWSCSLAAVHAWRTGRIGAWSLLVVTSVELGALFYNGTTEWGRAIALPGHSSVLAELLDARRKA